MTATLGALRVAGYRPAPADVPGLLGHDHQFTLLLGVLALSVLKGEVSRWWGLALIFSPVQLFVLG